MHGGQSGDGQKGSEAAAEKEILEDFLEGGGIIRLKVGQLLSSITSQDSRR